MIIELFKDTVALLKKTISNVFKKNTLEANIFTAASGTAIGALLVVIATPILTRIYSPEDFGGASVYISYLSIIAVMASLRYEWAIPLPKDDKIANNIVILCLLLLLITTTLFLSSFVFFGKNILLFVKVKPIAGLTYIATVYFFFFGFLNIINCICVREKDFYSFALSKVNLSIGQVFAQLFLGIINYGITGLIIGEVIGRLQASLVVISRILKKYKKIFFELDLKAVVNSAKRYKDFPIYSGPSTVINSAGLKLPVILMAINYGPRITGWFAFSQYLFAIPMTLLGQSVTQVFFSEAANLVRESPELLKRRFIQASKKLALMSLFIGIITICAPLFIKFILGEQWYETGIYIQLMAILFIPQFIVSPISHLTVHELQLWQLIWDIVRIFVVTAVFLLAKINGWPARLTIIFYSLGTAVCYVILFLLNLKAIDRTIKFKGK